MFTGWRSKRRLRRHVAIPEHHSLKRRASQDEEAPTDERSGLACQTIWCRYAPGIAGSMAKFSAKRKGRQSFAPRFVYPPKVQIKQMRGKLLPTSRVSCHRLPSVGKCSSAAQERAVLSTSPALLAWPMVPREGSALLARSGSDRVGAYAGTPWRRGVCHSLGDTVRPSHS
jgi:hypothetical protein